jgi:ABC-2 type transport system ATP-binding protein
VEVWTDSGQVDLGIRQQRFVLAILALKVNRLVPVDRLVDLTWAESPPTTARHAIQVRISRLRAAFTDAGADSGTIRIVTRGATYGLEADPKCIDVHRFHAALDAARAVPDDLARVAVLREALDMWRGPPLADVATPAAEQLVQGLEEARLFAAEEWLDAELRLGRHADVVHELTELVAQNPFRQRLVAQLMLALYRGGRTAEALDLYQFARGRLVGEFGLVPEVQLQELESAIIRADPALEPHRPVPERRPYQAVRQLVRTPPARRV